MIVPFEERIPEFTAIMFPEMPAVKTDSAILLGFGPGSGFIANEAAKLFHEGRFEHLIVAGGVPVATAYLSDMLLPVAIQMGQPQPLSAEEIEAEYMRRILIEKGVPAGNIHIESTSKTTIQNFENSKSALKDGESVTLVCFASTAPRAMSIARKQLDTPIIVPHTVCGFGFNQNNWAENPLSENFVMGEHRKLYDCIESGQGTRIDWHAERVLAQTLPSANTPHAAEKPSLPQLKA